MCIEQNVEGRVWNCPSTNLCISVLDMDVKEVLPTTRRISTHWAIQATLTVGHLTLLREGDR